MSNGTIGAICGPGDETSALAFGKTFKALAEQKLVIVVQFLNVNQSAVDWSLMERLEPELKIFQHQNMINGLNFAKKVMVTGECDLLVLDGILGLFHNQIISVDDFKQVLSSHGGVELILTGEELPAGMECCVSQIERIEHVKVDNL